MTYYKEEDVRTATWIDENFSRRDPNNWYEQDLFIKNIQPILPSTLKLISLPPTYNEGKFHCFIYTFGLHRDKSFLRKNKHSNVDFNSPEVQILINYLEKTDTPIPGDFAFYRRDQKITHGGIYVGNNLLKSKWGDGPILEHSIPTIQTIYGNEILFYKKTSPPYIKKLIKSHIKKDFSPSRNPY